jgi:hypothetical protein
MLFSRRSKQGPWKRLFFAGALVTLFSCLSVTSAHALAVITRVSGGVTVLKTGFQKWIPIRRPPINMENGDTVRTGFLGAATLTFPDGSHIDLTGGTSFTLKETAPTNFLMRINFGALKAFVAKATSRNFQVETPTAVCAVRGTEFRVKVSHKGTTDIALYSGLLAISDQKGHEILLHPNESIQVDFQGLGHISAAANKKGAAQLASFHSLMRRELALNQSRGQVQAMALRELRLADYEQGKSLIDAFGNRVRLEEYIIRPAPDQFKLVILNNSQTSGFNWFYYLGTFNTALPSNLNLAFNQLSGNVGLPNYYLLNYEKGESNTIDSTLEITQGGHPVNVNTAPGSSGSVAAGTQLWDTATNSYVSVTPGQAVYQTLFDQEGFYVDDKLKSGWSGTNIQTYSAGFGAASPTPASTTDPITGATLATALPGSTVASTIPNADQIHQLIYQSYTDGTFLQYDNYIINNLGQTAAASDFSGVTAGASFDRQILNFNYEQVITATEFQGRSINLVVAPKILLESGLIQ